MKAFTQAAGLEGDIGGVVPSEEGCVNIKAMDPPRYSQLDDAPVMTFNSCHFDVFAGEQAEQPHGVQKYRVVLHTGQASLSICKL